MKTEEDRLFLQNLGNKLRDIRNLKGWTLEETEDHGWPSWRHLQRIETGKNVTLLTIVKLSKLYKIKLEDIFKGL
ncbi:helix-turn-helix transcriptional regulator [Halobacteriovorax sp. JY17]|uniref:helix-turn-helix domain-containing protein n=1 Tax=Halobacteriovorax sp. JY17 TaxID=2014617 RepID=UPI000C3C17D4|nr:helix-turn-helix transcriptional regulator [Halobacteriovorax sp. JY17]PIK15522.1 MAG: hypothetical protein CES88_02030 [Halobacteriovorax sp. JY17]